jgi:hypothetical protein
MKKLLLLLSHGLVGFIGFAAGIYSLPILIAPDAPTDNAVISTQSSQLYSGEFKRDLTDSDALHWGQGQLSVSPTAISLLGKLSPGPNFTLYLSPRFIDTEADFNAEKSSMIAVGDIKTFNNFIVNVPANINVSNYNTVIVWCDSFGEFISAAQYK